MSPTTWPALWLCTAAVTGAAACASSTTAYEREAWERLARHDRALARTAHEPGADADATPPLDGSAGGYVLYAMHENPGLRAAYEEWRAGVHAIAERRRWPEPTLSYGLFLRRVETRVGPQRMRFGLMQMIPWPAKLDAASQAAAHMAAAAEQRFLAQGTTLRRRVADAYWQVWTIRQIRTIEREQRDLLAELAVTLRARIAVGKAGLADVAQVDLEISRRDDALAGLEEQETRARAMLRQAIGAPAGLDLPILDTPPPAPLPREDPETLRAWARAHPRIAAIDAMTAAELQKARRARLQGRPDFTAGIDYVETGPAMLPNVPDSGKNPIMVSVSVTLPVWRRRYEAGEQEALAQAAALRARRLEAENMAVAELDDALSGVRDAARRQALYQHTLIPQAETVYAAVIGSYHTGASTLASALLAQKNILELHRSLVQARAEHARAWARAEEVVGRDITAAQEEVEP